jgi:HEAT repeat protein
MSWQYEVERFRRWAAATSVQERTPEWEFEYPDWGTLYDAVRIFLASSSAHSWVQGQIDDLLFAIARDNEGEILADEIEEYPDMLLAWSEMAIFSPEVDAKWQLAARLGKLPSRRGEAESILVKFMDDADEYVRRRALLALGSLKSSRAEELAERAWQTGHEYQRIAALHVLKELASPKLSEYIRKAEEDGRPHLIHNAREVERS